MIGRQTPRQQPIHLLRPWAINIMCTQTSFHMSHRYLLIKSSQSCSCRSGSIPMYQYHIGLYLFQYITHTGQHTSGHIIQILSLLHDIQIIIRFDVEYLQHLIQHFPMLSGYAHHSLYPFWLFLEFFHQRSHLDCLRTGAEDQHHFPHISSVYNFFFISHQAYFTKWI